MKLDVLAFGAHPDDVELSCSGTLYKLKKQGKKVGIVDLTQGEMGTRGTAQTREVEAKEASLVLGLNARENLDIGDGWFENNKENKLKIITAIRKYRPGIILANAIDDRHPDHGKAAQLVRECVFLAGLRKIETTVNGITQEPWKTEHLFHYIQFFHIKPDFVIDISNEYEVKKKSIIAYKTQFFDPNSTEPKTLISSEKFLNYIEARAREFGAAIEVEYGEGFTTIRPLTYDLINLL
ncbi:MAG: hypothetical protein RLZZ337_1820 [Bacteroidota bacterium]|jgi:bacillithiol biosynthesis deacetylase BshB1